jgi:hypothetical protein
LAALPPLNSTTIPKYVTPLTIPPAMPHTQAGGIDQYLIGVRQFRQQVLPPGLPKTTVWSYDSAAEAARSTIPPTPT